MADRYVQLDILAEAPDGPEPRPTIYEAGDKLHFSFEGFSGTVDFAWYAHGEPRPWRSTTDADVALGHHAIYALMRGDVPPIEDTEFDGTPDWQIYYETYYQVPAGGSNYEYIKVPEPEEDAGDHEDDADPRVFRVVAVHFKPRVAKLHYFEKEWLYWQRVDSADPNDIPLQDIVAQAVRVLSVVEQASASDSYDAKSGRSGLRLLSKRRGSQD